MVWASGSTWAWRCPGLPAFNTQILGLEPRSGKLNPPGPGPLGPILLRAGSLALLMLQANYSSRPVAYRKMSRSGVPIPSNLGMNLDGNERNTTSLQQLSAGAFVMFQKPGEIQISARMA